MRAPRRWIPLPWHTAQAGEIVHVLWSDYYGAAMFGDDDEIARLPYKRCRLEIVATAASSHREVNFILPGQVVHYKGSFCFRERFELPSGTSVGLWHLVGFKLRLTPDAIGSVPSEDEILDRARGRSDRVSVI